MSHQAAIKYTESYVADIMKRYDPSHDAYHVNRVRKTALAIASTQEPPVDIFVVEMAALLHDVLDKKYVPQSQSSNPNTFFAPFFLTLSDKSGIDLIKDGRGLLISTIVDNVSWSTETKRRESGDWGEWHDNCVELHCVQDADRLDAIGAFGILRCAAYSAVVNQPLHLPPEEQGSGGSAIEHFHDKLLHIQSRLKTLQGKELGRKRHDVLLHFLASIDEEYGAHIPSHNNSLGLSMCEG